VCRLVVVGDGFCGKTSLMYAYAHNAVPSDYVPTVFDNFTKLTTYGSAPVQLQLWDTAGQEEYARIRPLSYPLTDLFIVCYSVAQPSSFHNVTTTWFPEIAHHAPDKPFILGLADTLPLPLPADPPQLLPSLICATTAERSWISSVSTSTP
jgi:Ras-related C3 botulinum toxin substrate 1